MGAVTSIHHGAPRKRVPLNGETNATYKYRLTMHVITTIVIRMNGRLKDEIGKRKGFDSLEQEVFLNLMRTCDFLSREMEELFKPSGLSSAQYNVLRILRGAGDEGLACGEIGNRMIKHDPDMTRMLDRLEKRELITRCRLTTDRRVVRARISPAGLELLATLDEPTRRMHKTQLAHMGERNLKMLMKLLEQARLREA